MRGWIDEARTGAAREFGARHHRGFMVFEVARAVVRALAWLLPVVALGASAWFAWHLVSAAWRPALAALVVVALIAVVARFRLLVPLGMVTMVSALVWVAWYVITGFSWWLLAVVGGLLLVGLLVSGRFGYRRTFSLGYWRTFL